MNLQPPSLQPDEYEALANFRYAVRRFLRFSRDYLAQRDLTPEQYEALLALRTRNSTGSMTIGDLSERLQVKHHTAVSLVNRLVERGCVTRGVDPADRRRVYVRLTKDGTEVIEEIARVHRPKIREYCKDMIAALRRLQK